MARLIIMQQEIQTIMGEFELVKDKLSEKE